MGRIADFVRLAVASDDYNEERLNYVDCPECGRSRKFMLWVNHEAGLAGGKCLAATCPTSVTVSLAPRGEREPMPERRPRLRATYKREPYTGLPSSVMDMLAGRYHLGDTEHFGLDEEARYSQAERRVAWNINAPDGTVRGVQLRAYDERKPKVITKPYDAFSPLISWYSVGNEEAPILIVEDIMSAYRAQFGGFTTLALLGTNLSAEAADEVAHYAASRPQVMVALDRDAAGKAMKMARDLRGYCPGTLVEFVLLGEDLKDLTATALDSLLAQLRGSMDD